MPELLSIDLRQMILAVETTVDLVGMNDGHHGKRVGYIASQILHALGHDEDELSFAFELGLLHDCGVSTEQVHANLVNQFDWEGSQIHCEIGYELLHDFEPLSAFAVPIRFHHTHWSDLQRMELDPRNAFLANLIFLADRIDVTGAAHYERDILLARNEIVRTMQSYRDTFFRGDLVDAFIEAQRSEAFWISLEDRHITRYTWEMGQFQSPRTITPEQLKQLALIMAYVVDQKSPFTAQHSARVGALARHLSELHGLDRTQSEKIEVAGYLHDLGKLRVPDEVLDKPGPLTDRDRAIMNQHSYETYEILRHITGLEDIARWAAYHHEWLNGSGYPFHPETGSLSVEARIVAVADIFQALAQDRPYRAGMALAEVLQILDEEASRGRLDREIVALARQHGESCFEIARDYGDDPVISDPEGLA